MVKNKKSVLYLFLFILIGGLAYSCQNRPKEVLNRKQMERLMYDIYIAEATMENDYQNFDTPEKKEAYINRVFKAHKITPAQWDSSLSWYSDKIDIYLKMNDSVKSRLQRSRQEVDLLIAQQSRSFQDPSLLPLSYLPPMYDYSRPGIRKGFRFRLDSTEISSKITGDDFMFSFKVIGIPSRFDAPFISVLELTYSDTTIYRLKGITENKTYEFSASKYIPGDTITGISGFIHLQDLGKVPPIQLYNIYLGDIPSTSSASDSLEIDSREKTLRADSITFPEPDSVKRAEPDSIGKVKLDSIERVESDSVKRIESKTIKGME